MQVSKSLLIICAATVCAGFISVQAQDNPAQAAARAALMEKMNALETSQTPPPTASPTIETPAPATTMPAAIEPAPSPALPVVPATMPATNAVAAQSPPKSEQPVKQAGNGSDLKPMVAPPLPISVTKEEQLQALNAKYVANQISPQEYFKQREAILNGQ